MIDPTAMVSPMDVHMADPSPISIGALNLSPRRTQPGAQPDFGAAVTAANAAASNIVNTGKNIFATAAVSAANKWEPTNASSLPSLSDIEDSDAEDDDDEAEDEMDNIPVLPSPTRNTDTTDPFKPRAKPSSRPSIGGIGRHKTMPNPLHRVGGQQRLASTPNLFAMKEHPSANSGAQVKSRPNSAVPVIATSPARKVTTANAISPHRSSPRKTAAAPATSNATATGKSTEPVAGGLKSKKGMQHDDMIHKAMQNRIQGRTLVELAQARAGGRDVGANFNVGCDGEVDGLISKRPKSAVFEVARWDPERDEMPSPFLKKGIRIVR